MQKKFGASMAIQILPKMEQKEGLKAIDKVIEHLLSKGLNAFVSPFETVIEGELEEILQAFKECIEIASNESEEGFMSYIKLNYNPKGVLSIDEKTSKYSI